MRNPNEIDPESNAELRPFRAVVAPQSNQPEQETQTPSDGFDTDDEVDLSLDAIEAAYLKALESADVAESSLPPFPREEMEEDTGTEAIPQPQRIVEQPASPADCNAELERDELDDSPDVTMTQVIEGLLFVGGAPLSTKKLVDVLGGSQQIEQVEELLDAISHRYVEEGRPYEIRLVEGGYRLHLREAFEPVRRRVYGQGPKEVKLSQDALEVLAFVAYQQPVTREQLHATEKANSAAILRQLLRRQLVRLERDESNSESYVTTARFLDLFGLASLSDLPQAVDFQFR